MEKNNYKDIPKLGFGLMRLPMIDGEVDIEQTKQMVDLFMENGFTYFDTAYGYLDGKSEEAVKIALVDRYPRESFKLATKLPAWIANSEEEAKQMLATSLKRTGAGYFDFYLLHNLGVERTAPFESYNMWDFVKEQKEKGILKNIGFSIHDKAEALEKVLKIHPDMDFVQLQINYADWDNEQVESKKCYDVARKYNMPIVIMEPVKGGILADLPIGLNDVLLKENGDASISSWAIRYAASLDGIITVLSGMSNVDQVKDNISFMKDLKPFTEAEYKVISKVQDAMSKINSIPCTGCNYCTKDCPKNIIIPDIFEAMNRYLTYNNLPAAKSQYDWAIRNDMKASDCVACGQCESVCPQQIKIIDQLARVASVLD
ncbi:MAG: aldo/keto reductase [Anaerovoracaceae bacterium]